MITDSFASPAARRFTLAAARFGLPGPPPHLGPRPLDPADWTAVAQTVQRHRLTGLFAASVEAGVIPTTPEQRANACDLHAGMVGTCLRLERDLVTVVADLASEGVETRVLKGPAFAHLDYPHPRLRVFGDVDLLLRGSQWARAVQVVERRGYARQHLPLRAGFDARFTKGASFVGPTRRELDLHRTLAQGPFGLSIDLEDLWDHHCSVRIGGQDIPTMDADRRFLHACYHAALGKRTMQLAPLRDLAGMASRSVDPIDPGRIVERAASWGGAAVVARAVRAAWELFELEPDALSTWAARYRPSAAEQRGIRLYTDPHLGFASLAVATIRTIPGISNKWAFALGAAFPQAGFAAGRHTSVSRRWRSALEELWRLRRRSV